MAICIRFNHVLVFESIELVIDSFIVSLIDTGREECHCKTASPIENAIQTVMLEAPSDPNSIELPK
jgi:hypothetical protein